MVRGERKATRDDVARLARVSTAVVSYVVNGGPRPVAENTRRRVLDAIDQLNYRPSAAARALKLSRSHVIGLVVPDISNSFFAEFAKHLQEACHEVGYSVMLGTTENGAMETAQVSSLLTRDLDGLVVFGIERRSLLDSLLSTDVPLVSMDWQLQDGDVPTIVADDYGATVDAIEHLSRVHGHQRIGFIGGPHSSIGAMTRRRAWRDSLEQLTGTAPPDRWAVSAPFTRFGGLEAMNRLRSLDGVTAVFASSDIQAIGALRALDRAGVAVPEDIAIMSFDGTLEAEYSSPPLSVVAVPIEAMARHALASILSRPSDTELHAVFAHNLVLRASCGCDQ